MSATPAEIRQAIAARLTALGTDWRESPFHPDALSSDPSGVAHQTFLVSVGESVPELGTQRTGARLYVRTSGAVRFYARITPKDQLDAYDAALAGELTVLRQLAAAGWSSTFHWVWDGTTRSRSQDTPEWQVVEIRFSALHYLSLQ